MFGILGTAFALFMFGTSAIVNLYQAGKYSADGAKYKITKVKEVRNAAFVSFFVDVIAFVLLAF
jgi:hypothetical protein